MAISSITITDERLQNQSFTQGYYDADLGLAAKKDSGVDSIEDLSGQPVGALSTSTGETWIQENTAQYGFGEYRGYDTQQNLLLDLQNGRIAGAVSDITGLNFAFQQMSDLHVVQRIRSGDRYGIITTRSPP
jgi:polar amino acid transport system substrate-binding protein